MQWSDDYAIGVKRVDLQHKKLIAMIDDLRNSLAAGCSDRDLANTIRFLVDYTKYHFRDEEEVMRAIDFSDFEAHKLRHREFVDKVASILMALKKGKGCNDLDLVGFLVQWTIGCRNRTGAAGQVEPRTASASLPAAGDLVGHSNTG